MIMTMMMMMIVVIIIVIIHSFYVALFSALKHSLRTLACDSELVNMVLNIHRNLVLLLQQQTIFSTHKILTRTHR